MRYPNDNVGIVVLSNDETALRLIDIVKWCLSEVLLGLEHVDWESRFVLLTTRLLAPLAFQSLFSAILIFTPASRSFLSTKTDLFPPSSQQIPLKAR